MGVSQQTYFRWKKQYAGLGISELRRLKRLESENSSREPRHQRVVSHTFLLSERSLGKAGAIVRRQDCQPPLLASQATPTAVALIRSRHQLSRDHSHPYILPDLRSSD
jgi:hypothetical protein